MAGLLVTCKDLARPGQATELSTASWQRPVSCLPTEVKASRSQRQREREREDFCNPKSQEMLIIVSIKGPPVFSGLTQRRNIYFSALAFRIGQLTLEQGKADPDHHVMELHLLR